jgi:hypothetical protein
MTNVKKDKVLQVVFKCFKEAQEDQLRWSKDNYEFDRLYEYKADKASFKIISVGKNGIDCCMVTKHETRPDYIYNLNISPSVSYYKDLF